MDNPAKVNDLEIALWAFKNIQNITGSNIKNFQLKNQHKPSCKFEYPFCCCCCCWHYLHRIFLSGYLSGFVIKFENLWKWFEFIHHSFLVNNTWVCKMLLPYMLMLLPLKVSICCIYTYRLFVWDSRDIRGLYFINFSSEKYILVKM